MAPPAPDAMTDATLAIICSAITGAITAIPALVTTFRINGVKSQVSEVKEVVDGPLSVALQNNAELAAKVAELTGEHGDAVAAAKAAILNENRKAGKQEPPMKPVK